ncbi:hypothetical protein HELRODRAFT_160283 [Helobdella robusta]|uniref:CUB domain-containing protein n=1 Tax=Helobdella robusta TaxID=6412 RepID=T1EQ18_HELRO|nr:hypothetical protein HELRODRAFT_160283 [Helobdella robusta]ESO06137.1 hypothetical protein HELRODRAFT_160283 [Helobdella robusta]
MHQPLVNARSSLLLLLFLFYIFCNNNIMFQTNTVGKHVKNGTFLPNKNIKKYKNFGNSSYDGSYINVILNNIGYIREEITFHAERTTAKKYSYKGPNNLCNSNYQNNNIIDNNINNNIIINNNRITSSYVNYSNKNNLYKRINYNSNKNNCIISTNIFNHLLIYDNVFVVAHFNKTAPLQLQKNDLHKKQKRHKNKRSHNNIFNNYNYYYNGNSNYYSSNKNVRSLNCPWKIKASTGQQITLKIIFMEQTVVSDHTINQTTTTTTNNNNNVNNIDGLTSITTNHNNYNLWTSYRPKRCGSYLYVRDVGINFRKISLCGDETTRERPLLTSSSNELLMYLQDNDEDDDADEVNNVGHRESSKDDDSDDGDDDDFDRDDVIVVQKVLISYEAPAAFKNSHKVADHEEWPSNLPDA